MSFDHHNLVRHTVKARGWRGTGKLLYCTGWFGNSQRVRLGIKPTGHSWKVGDPSDPLDYCYVCRKRRRDLMEPKPITLEDALKGN